MKKCGLRSTNIDPVNGRGVWLLESAGNEGDFWSNDAWKKVINVSVQEYGLKRWMNEMKNKTLISYESKSKPKREFVYDGSYNSELFFKARTHSLEVNALTYRWNVGNDKECYMFMHAEESVFQLIVECIEYARGRMGLMYEDVAVFGYNLFEHWNEDEQKCMCELLGLSDSNNKIIEPMKIFLESA